MMLSYAAIGLVSGGDRNILCEWSWLKRMFPRLMKGPPRLGLDRAHEVP